VPRCRPDAWLTADARQRARIPARVRFQEKWRLALTLWRQIRAAGFDVTAVLGDAEFGDDATLRRTCLSRRDHGRRSGLLVARRGAQGARSMEGG
jgi:SRSO17 transposase